MWRLKRNYQDDDFTSNRKHFVVTLLGCHPHCPIMSAPIITDIPFGDGLVGVLSIPQPGIIASRNEHMDGFMTLRLVRRNTILY